MRVFISHSSEDGHFIDKLQEYLRASLSLDREQVLATSAAETQLRPGEKVDDKLRQYAVEADTFVAVLSARSLQSIYVLFELGARWGSQKTLIPVLMPDLSPEQLSAPLDSFHAVRAGDEAELVRLVTELARALKIELKQAPEDCEAAAAAARACSHKAPQTYAVLSYVVDANGNFAMLQDANYQTVQPPGRQLIPNERPHEVALDVASRETGLEKTSLQVFPSEDLPAPYPRATVVHRPYQVQVERGDHRQALVHYDFVYVFTTRYADPTMPSAPAAGDKVPEGWRSVEVLRERLAKAQALAAAGKSWPTDDQKWPPHPDIPDTMERILRDLQAARS